MENVLLGTKKIVTKIDKKTCNVHEKNKKNPVKSKEIEKKWVCKKLWKMQCLLVNLSIKLYIYIYTMYIISNTLNNFKDTALYLLLYTLCNA